MKRKLYLMSIFALSIGSKNAIAQTYSLDPTFDTDGYKIVSTLPNEWYTGVLLKDDGSSWIQNYKMNQNVPTYSIGIFSLQNDGSVNNGFGTNGYAGLTGSTPYQIASEIHSKPNGGCWVSNEFYWGGNGISTPLSSTFTDQLFTNTSFDQVYGSVQVNDSMYVILGYGDVYSYKDRSENSYGSTSGWFNGSISGGGFLPSNYQVAGDASKQVWDYCDELGLASDGGLLIPIKIAINTGNDGYQLGLLKLLPNSLTIDNNFGTNGSILVSPVRTDNLAYVTGIRSLSNGNFAVVYNNPSSGNDHSTLSIYSSTGSLQNTTELLTKLCKRMEVDANNNVFLFVNGTRFMYAYTSTCAALAINGANNYLDLGAPYSSTNIIDIYGSSINSSGDIMISGTLTTPQNPSENVAVAMRIKRAGGINLGLTEETTESLTIYPNPTSDLFNVEFNSENTSNFSIFSADNREVLKGELTSGNNTIDIQELVAGTYFLKTIVNGTAVTKKISKQ